MGVKFEQDNVSRLKSTHFEAWFRESNIELLEWPTQSPLQSIMGIIKALSQAPHHKIKEKT